MTQHLEPALVRDLTEAKAALARHGIVIIRSIETELEPVVMAAAKESMAASPGILAKMDDDDHDSLVESLRKKAMKATGEMKGKYTHLLAKLGTDYIGDLVKELDGINELFSWERMTRSATTDVSDLLRERGFGPLDKISSEDVSENFAVELTEKWPESFKRFQALAEQAAKLLLEKGVQTPPKQKEKKARRKG